MQEEQDTLYHFVKTDKAFATFSFSKSPFPLLFPPMDAPHRNPPPRFSVTRLRNWDPILNDMLIVASANSSDVAVLTNTSEPMAPDQETVNDFHLTNLIDSRKAQVPQMSLGEQGDSVLIGEALDLSSKDKVQRPAPRLEEVNESSTPLPEYLLLTHEGMLAAWWVVWDKSIEGGMGYHGLTYEKQKEAGATPAKSGPSEQKMASVFGQPASAAGSTQGGLQMRQPAATFGTPSTPKFGTTGFGSTTPTFGKPSQPAFGSASTFGAQGGSAFGATGGLGSRQSPWGSAPQTSASQTSATPFSNAAGGPSGFARFGTNAPSGGSAFSSFGSTSGQSGFAALGQQQKSAFGGTTNGFKGLSTEPSFGSTVTVGSGTGSTLPSWANTPAQQGGSIFGQGTSSFASTKESDMSDADEAQNRERDEATPTPQGPPPQPKNLFGLPSDGFKLGNSFKSDGSTQEGEQKPAPSAGGFSFGVGFGSALDETKPPATPIKQLEQKAPQAVSTTPASPPKPPNLMFPGATPAKDTLAPKAPPPKEEQLVPEDAPLPPDPMTWKPPKTDEDLPPLAGSPPIKVEAPESSSVPSSPLQEGSGDISVEEDRSGDEETEEPSPSDAARRSRPSKTGWTLQDSINQSPRIFPAAPTPPVVKSRTSSRSGRSTSPPRPLFGHASKPAAPFGQAAKSTPSFGQPKQTPQSAVTGGFPRAPMPLTPSQSRVQDNLRSPSPARAASTSVIGTRREPLTAPGASLSASIQQQPKPPTPQPLVSDLIDDEDERIRLELASEIEPSRTLDAFLARQEYSGASINKTGHAAQIEIVYRDINNMVDTLGLNWRSLKAFLEYHQRPQRNSEVTRRALEEVVEQGEDGPWFEKWCLAEIEDLKKLENELEQELDKGRVEDVLDKLSQLARLLREKARLMTKLNDIRRQIINRKDPEKVEALRKASLPKELADQQKGLRGDYARLLTLLGQAEEATILLRSKLASHNAENGKTGAVPTVDAVKRTINKLITVTEKRNSEIAVLESQLRKIGLSESSRPNSSSSRQLGTPRGSRGLRSESPFATPPTNRSRMSLSELNRRALTPEVESTPTKGYGFYYTPEGSPTTGEDLARLGDMVDDNLPELRETAKRRRKIAEGLATALVDRGVKVTRV